MCKSVPQMDATLTLTRTSVGPNAGTLTSRISAPGAGWAFTTACIVSCIRHAPAKQPILAKKAGARFSERAARIQSFKVSELFADARGALRNFETLQH